jgi:hypothetical protein
MEGTMLPRIRPHHVSSATLTSIGVGIYLLHAG